MRWKGINIWGLGLIAVALLVLLLTPQIEEKFAGDTKPGLAPGLATVTIILLDLAYRKYFKLSAFDIDEGPSILFIPGWVLGLGYCLLGIGIWFKIEEYVTPVFITGLILAGGRGYLSLQDRSTVERRIKRSRGAKTETKQ